MRNKGESKSEIAPQKRFIALAIPHLSDQGIELVQGIRRSILPFGDSAELLILSGGYETHLRKLANLDKLAGAIGEFISPLWLESLQIKGVPVVQPGSAAGEKIPSVDTDREGIGKEAVSTLLNQGVKSLGYLGASGPSDSTQLWKAYSHTAASRGYTARGSNEFSAPMLREFISSLSSPAGLLCSSDRLARLAILTAQDLGLRIPLDLAVIGVGNSRMESLYLGMEISSFELPLREIGLRAGSLLLEILSKNQQIPGSHRVAAKLHERETSIRSGSGVTRVMAFLRSNPGTELNAGELARLAGMSRRSFEVAMQKESGDSPGSFLQKIRRNSAEKMLLETDEEIAAIARSCGYQEPAVFSSAFKRWTGKSPRDYRKLHRSG